MKELTAIQQELKAPKSQRNSFGNYNYRNCEDILTAVKPLLAKNGCSLTLSDSMQQIGNHNYVQCTATLMSAEGEQVWVQGWAREAESRKGMDDSQITGATSSYARKYALNGLFAIDDVADSDATNTHGKTAKPNVPDNGAADQLRF